MAANGGETTNLSHDTTAPEPVPTSNPLKRKPVAEQKDDDLITHLATPKRSPPKPCGNTYSVYRCGHRQASTESTGITHTEDCPGLLAGEWFCTNINPSGIKVQRADEYCPRCLHKQKNNYPYGHPYFSSPYYNASMNQYPKYSSRVYGNQAQQPIPTARVPNAHFASSIHPNSTLINTMAETQNTNRHNEHDLYNDYQELRAMNYRYPQQVEYGPGLIASPVPELYEPLGPIPPMPPGYLEAPSLNTVPAETFTLPTVDLQINTSMHHDPLDFNSFVTYSKALRGPLKYHLVSPEGFTPNHDVASTSAEASKIKVELPPGNATHDNASSIPIQGHSTPESSKENKEVWRASRNDDPSQQPVMMPGKDVNSTTESQEHRQVQFKNYLKDNKLPISLARLHESVDFMETHDTRISLKQGSRLDYALRNAGFQWPGSYSSDENPPTVRNGSIDKIPLVPAESPQAAEIQRPFPPRKSSIPVHAKHFVTLATPAEPNPNTGSSSKLTDSSVKQPLGHNVEADNSDESNRFENAAAKSVISNTSRSAAFTGGVDKKFLNRPWRQQTGPSASTKGFSFETDKIRPSQASTSTSKAKEESPVEVATIKMSAVAIPQSRSKVGTIEKSIPLASTPEAPVIPIAVARESRPIATNSEEKKIPQAAQQPYNSFPTPGYSTLMTPCNGYSTFMTSEEQASIMERHRALMQQQRNPHESARREPHHPLSSQITPATIVPAHLKSGTSQAPQTTTGSSTFMTREEQAAIMERQCALLEQQRSLHESIRREKEIKLGESASARRPLLPDPYTLADFIQADLKSSTSQIPTPNPTATRGFRVEKGEPSDKTMTSTPTFEAPRLAVQPDVPAVTPALMARGSRPIASDWVRKDKKLDEHSTISKDEEVSEEVSEENDSWDVISEGDYE